jgi:hypothetical protein
LLNDRLFDLLKLLDADELEQVWVRYLRKAPDDNDFHQRSREQRVEPVSRELRYLAAHSIADIVNRRKDHDYPWVEIVRQVNEKLNLPTTINNDNVTPLEDALLAHLSTVAGKSETLAASREASRRAIDVITSQARWAPWSPRRPLSLLKSIATARMIWGPNYRKLIPAVLFILSAARTHEALNGEVKS